jgi:hypothetical protein
MRRERRGGKGGKGRRGGRERKEGREESGAHSLQASAPASLGLATALLTCRTICETFEVL